METCENCGREIGNLETPYIWQDRIVCAICYPMVNPALETRLHQLEAENSALRKQLAELGGHIAATHPAPRPASHPSAASGFRGVEWGVSLKEVRTREMSELLKDVSNDTQLVYNGLIAGLSCNVVYLFVDGKLAAGKYVLTEKHANDNLHLEDSHKLKAHLTEKYGKPADEETWKDDHFKGDHARRGLAVSRGDLSLHSTWETADEKITLTTQGDNARIHVDVRLASKKLPPAIPPKP